jgi:hypothetical protein
LDLADLGTILVNGLVKDHAPAKINPAFSARSFILAYPESTITQKP